MLVILGGGESGIGAALLARKNGIPVFVSDSGNIAGKNELIAQDIPFEEGGHDIDILLRATEVIKSPGIPPHAPVMQMVRTKGIPVMSEIEWSSRFFKGTVIGITGTNGKSTTTNLTWHLLNEGGLNVAKGGNLGESFARLLLGEHPDVVVLELSSFQLEDIRDFHPYISVWLNLTPDHLDRYDYSLQNYAEAKFRITENQTADDWFVYDGSSQIIQDCLERHPREVGHVPIQPGQWGMGWASPIEGVKFRLTNPMLMGRHNAFNACCSTWVALKMGVNEAKVQEGLDSFVNDPHRMEPVGEIDGVRYVNDSKATNVDAVQFALEGIPGPIIWIAGGTDKGNDYSPLLGLARDKVAALICLGVDNKPLKEAFSGVIPKIEETRSVDEAVKWAKQLASPGTTVLLSPACASFDLFKNYKDRGDRFRNAVKQLE